MARNGEKRNNKSHQKSNFFRGPSSPRAPTGPFSFLKSRPWSVFRSQAAIAASAAAEEAGSAAQHVAELSARAAGVAAGELAAEAGNTAMKSAEIAAKAGEPKTEKRVLVRLVS